jgi:hypothetical protein
VWLQYVSHKVGRLLVPWALIGALVSSAALAGRHWIFTAAFVAQALFYGLAVVGALLDSRDRRPGQPAANLHDFPVQALGKEAR